jgi:hypothetical protein
LHLCLCRWPPYIYLSPHLSLPLSLSLSDTRIRRTLPTRTSESTAASRSCRPRESRCTGGKYSRRCGICASAEFRTQASMRATLSMIRRPMPSSECPLHPTGIYVQNTMYIDSVLVSSKYTLRYIMEANVEDVGVRLIPRLSISDIENSLLNLEPYCLPLYRSLNVSLLPPLACLRLLLYFSAAFPAIGLTDRARDGSMRTHCASSCGCTRCPLDTSSNRTSSSRWSTPPSVYS